MALGIVVAIYSTKKEEFSMEDLPVTVVKTETILLPGVPEPEAIVEPEIERVQFMKREAEAGETIVVVERVIPPDAIELKSN